MNIDRLNQWLTLVANLGVVAGIVFLGIEIQQNTRSSQAQTRASIASNQLWLVENLANNAEILSRSNEPLEGADEIRYSAAMTGMFFVWENEWYQYRQGLYQEDAFQPQLNRWERALQSQQIRDQWKSTRELYSSDFGQKIDEIVDRIDSQL